MITVQYLKALMEEITYSKYIYISIYLEVRILFIIPRIDVQEDENMHDTSKKILRRHTLWYFNSLHQRAFVWI